MAASQEVPIKDLPWVRARLSLFQAGNRDAVALKRAQDRTSLLVRRWQTLTENLSMIRAQTMTAIEATESKGGAVTLRIFDRPKFDAIKQSIRSQEEQITGLEGAIRELDGMHAGFISEMHDLRSSLGAVEAQQRTMLNSWAATALQKRPNIRLPAEEVLATDQLYLQKKAQVETQIKNAKEGLDVLLPQIEKVEAILEGVGC